MNTKEKILAVSLDMFAKQGYTAVSIRDICKQVGIKESSVYYHFKNKQSIFDELIERFTEIANNMISMLENGLANGQDSFSDGFNTTADYFFEKYLMDDFCNKVMRVLLIEQFGSEAVRRLCQEWLLDKPLEIQSKIFSALISFGMISKANSDYLAVKYYSPIYFYANKWLFSGELTEEKKTAFRNDVYKHIQMFFMETGGNNG
ncbi:MAG: TetR/AcrR family transcriptional regulator [Acutalibacteraceae bacterium]|nr:TetR/AcrR family transcriptional regulator [Acutalibacteraceae bacterium]